MATRQCGLGGIRWEKVNLVQRLRSPQEGDELCWSERGGRAGDSNDGRSSLSEQKYRAGRKGRRDVCLAGMREWAHEQSPAQPTLHLEERNGRSTLNMRDGWNKGGVFRKLQNACIIRLHTNLRGESHTCSYCTNAVHLCSQLLHGRISAILPFSIKFRAHKSSYHKCTERTLAIICIYCLFHHLLQPVSMRDLQIPFFPSQDWPTFFERALIVKCSEGTERAPEQRLHSANPNG